ncbi:hypothetical protein AWV80_13605 [Cupriavidus sp. UYMU48A]|nr:hypothetical protein AWV80_13605 [Cupriavidus sp. UYMU48A]
MARLATGRWIVAVLAFAVIICTVAMTFGGYRLLDWRTYTAIRSVKIYPDIVDVPPEYTRHEEPSAVLLPGSTCRLVAQYAKDFYSSRVRCDNGIVGWTNEPEAFSPPIPIS